MKEKESIHAGYFQVSWDYDKGVSQAKEHNPPHIHAIYGDFIGMFSISDGEMFEGDIPEKA